MTLGQQQHLPEQSSLTLRRIRRRRPHEERPVQWSRFWVLAFVATTTPTLAFVRPFFVAPNIQHSSSVLFQSSRTPVRPSQRSGPNETYENRNESERRQGSQSPRTSQNDVERLIVTAGRQGRTDAALQLYRDIPAPQRTIRHVNAAIDACARARPVRLTQAFGLVDSLPNMTLSPNVYTYGSLMNAISRAGRVDIAVQVLDAMTNQTTLHAIRPNAVVYQSAITAAANAEPPQPDIAWQLLQRAHDANVTLTVVGYNAALTAASRAGQAPRAVHLLRRMQNATSHVLPRPDAVTYGTVMAACETCHEWRQVVTLAEEMQAAGHALDGLAMTSVLHACQQCGWSSLAVQYLNRMKTLSPHEHERRRHTQGRHHVGSKQALSGPDAVAYRLAISACARGGAWAEGVRLLDEYCNDINRRDVVAYTAAVHGCEVAGEWNEALRLLRRMRLARVEPNEVTLAAVIGACAKACANVQSLHRPGATTHRPNDKSMPPPLRKALQILNVMRKDDTVVNPNIQVYNAAIRACAEGLDVTRAFQLLPMLRDDGLEPNVVTYGTLMMACQRVGSLTDMTRVFQLMRNDGIAPNEIIYGAALSCCRKAGEAERAFLLLQKMIRDGLHPNVATFNTVLLAQTEGKNPNQDLDRASKVVRLLTEPQEYKISATANRQTYTILIKALAADKRPREAEAALILMRSNGIVADVDLYTATISSYERIGQPLNALRLMESMRADGYDFYEVGVLNTLFKRVVKLANAVGQTLTKSSERIETKLVPPPASLWNETSIA